MAVGQFIDYTALPQPGAYSFKLQNGRDLVAAGPEAERLKNMLDAARGPDLRLAQAPVPTGREDERLGMSVPDVAPAMSVAPPQAPAASAPAPGTGPAQPAGATPAAPPGPGQSARDVANAALAYATRPRMRPGKPAVTKEQLESQATQAVQMPTQSEVVVEGGFPVDEDYLEAQSQLSIDRRLAAQEAADRAAAAAEQERDLELENVARTAERVRVQQEQADEAERRVQQDQRLYDETRRVFRESKVDPNRIFSGVKGTVAAIFSAVAQGLGAYGATLGRTPNYAQQIIQAAIDRDIAAQEKEIQVRGEAANNALSQLTRSLGDRQQAKILLEQLQKDYVSSQRAQIAAATKRDDIIARAQEWDINEQQRLLENQQLYLERARGKVVQRVAATAAYPQKGQAPHMSEPTAKEVAADLANVGAAVGIGQQSLQIDKTVAETDKLRADAQKEAAGGDMPAETARTLANMDSGLDQAISIAEKYGYKVDRATGEITEGEGAAFPSRGKGLIPGVPSNPEFQAFSGDMAAFGRLYAGVLNPTGEPSSPLIERVTPDPTAPDANIKAQLQSAIQNMLQIRRNWAANATAQQRAIREAEKLRAGAEQRSSQQDLGRQSE